MSKSAWLVEKLIVSAVVAYWSQLTYGLLPLSNWETYHLPSLADIPWLCWSVGPLFGSVVLLWYVPTLRELVHLRSLAFLVASTLIYVGALYVSLIPAQIPIYTLLGIAMGTALLAIAQAVFLKASWLRVGIAIVGTYGTWFAFANARLSSTADWALDFFVWQGAYLLFMFGRISKRQSQT